MRPFQSVVLFVLFTLSSTLIVGAASSQEVPLARVARDAGLQYEWLSASRVVQLSGPGIVLVVRPGENLYEVNDRVEVTAEAPHYISNDVYVSQALATHITNLARQEQLLIEAQEAQAVSEAGYVRNEVAAGETHGTIALNVAPLQGAEALLITGQAPPSVPVMITLLATLSSDLPNVLLSRHNLTAGPDGKFQAIVPIAPDYLRDSIIHVLATSTPGVISASAQLLVHAPNNGVKVPAEATPGGIW
ncbi:MAG TPA: stalk domain-containing protein [Candidatus Cybelea sp.]|jgi:hypothetical protein|nr:stalk domain-containing protein [Candidatus Cybelea sp.]